MQPENHKILRLLLVRHGETEDNKTKTIAGHKPGKLTPNGIKQAQCIGLYFEKEKKKFDFIYVSDLGRTKQTFEAACSKCAQLKNSSVTFTPLIRERGGGILEGKPISTWEQNAKKQSLNIRVYKCQGGQSWVDVNKRVTKFLQNLIIDHLDPSNGKNEVKVLAVTHGGFIMQFLNVYNRIKGLPAQFNNTALNCSMHQFQIVYPYEFYQMKQFLENKIEINYNIKNFVGHLNL